MEIVVGITGASGAVYGVRLLKALKELKVDTHLILTEAAEKIVEYELGLCRADLVNFATYCHDIDDLTTSISSGSYKTDGMVVAPCSLKTLAGIAYGYSENLLLRAADVTLKEGRLLILVPRETPLSIIHLENMLKAARAGAVILPAMPAFYHKPRTIDDLADYVVGKILDRFRIEHNLYERWRGLK